MLLALFSLLFMLLLAPLGTRDIRYFMPAWPTLMVLAAAGLTQFRRLSPWGVGGLAALLLLPYAPYYITHTNPLLLGPLTAPQLIKLGGGQGLDQAAAYLNARPGSEQLTTATYLPESFAPYFHGHTSEHKSTGFADVAVVYLRQIQNQHPSAEHLAYYAARPADDVVRLNGIDYAWVYLTPPPRLVTGVSFDGIELVGQTLDARFAPPGESRQMTLLWRAPSTAAATLVRLQLRDATGQVWAEAGGPLLTPNGPSAVEGHYRLDIPPDTLRGSYDLWVSVGEAETWAKISQIEVHRFSPPADIGVSVQINFDGKLLLHGFQLSNLTPAPGQTLDITFHWQTLQPVGRSYTNFVHLLDATGATVVQLDAIPGGGAWPTDTWREQEWLADTVSLTLPADLPPGKYDLITGWYAWDTGERLPIAGDAGSGGVAYLTSVMVGGE